jgi:23S rRNA pseudouridine1911/1915/1917 synthase
MVCGEKVYLRRLHGKPVKDRSGAPRQALHAAELGFVHPVTGQRLEFQMPLPDDMNRLLERLRNPHDLGGVYP